MDLFYLKKNFLLSSFLNHPFYSLLEKVQTENPSWKESGVAFIGSVTRLLERLLDYRSVMQGEENRDKRMTCTVNLLNFYKNEINRKEMYLRFDNDLYVKMLKCLKKNNVFF